MVQTAKRTVRAQVDRSHLSKHTEQFSDWPKAVRELAWNGIDGGAKSITISFVKEGGRRHLRVLDDGDGISDAGLEAMVSLDFSPSADDPKKRGKNGNGSKGFVHHASALRVETRRAGEGQMLRIEYTPDELMELWNRGTGEWTISEPSAGHQIRVCGTLVTMLDIGKGEGVDPKHDRSAKRLIEELGQIIPSYVARKVTIVDEQGRSHKLKPRRILGTRIEGEGEIEGIGEVSYELFVVPDPETVQDRLEVWAMEAVCDVRSFLARIRPTPALATLLRGVRAILGHPQFGGMIMMPGLNRLVGNDRDSFKQALYDDEDLVYAIVRFLHSEILPKAELALGKEASDRTRSADVETMRSELVKALQAAGSAATSTAPIGDVDFDTLQVTPSKFELEPGQQISLEIKNPEDDTSYRWDASASGGSIDRKIGAKITYTAGAKQGLFLLVASDGEHRLEIPIPIVAELPFGFATRVRHVAPGHKITLRLVNTHRTSGEFRWDDSECGGTLRVSADTLEAEYMPEGTEAVFRVSVLELSPPEHRAPKTASCTIYVEQQNDRPELRRPSDTVFRYPAEKGELFELELYEFAGPETIGLGSYITLGAGDRPHRITINTGYAGITGQPSAVQHVLSLELIAMRIAERLMTASGELALAKPEETADLLQRRAGRIFADILPHWVRH